MASPDGDIEQHRVRGKWHRYVLHDGTKIDVQPVIKHVVVNSKTKQIHVETETPSERITPGGNVVGGFGPIKCPQDTARNDDVECIITNREEALQVYRVNAETVIFFGVYMVSACKITHSKEGEGTHRFTYAHIIRPFHKGKQAKVTKKSYTVSPSPKM